MREELGVRLRRADEAIAGILERVLGGRELVVEEAEALFDADAKSLPAVLSAADHLRWETVGDDVSYVVNRNINFTNVCVKRCSFCAFSRTYRSREGYYLPVDEIVRRAGEAIQYGATEVCIQAGLPPDMEGDLYIRLCRALKTAFPQLHLHAFSPEEVLYGSQRSGRSVRWYLSQLQDAGVGSLPGTSAEVLVQEIRDRISPGRITVAEWLDVIETAHVLGIPTTSTLMYGHVERSGDCARHLVLLRDLQKRRSGFTEFVPLSFVHSEAPLFSAGVVKKVRPGATADEVLKMHAVSRLVLHPWIRNIQTSWVKEGLAMAERCLAAGANDLGGTLINESISTAAGSPYGQLVRPRDLRECIRRAGRIPVERSTLYAKLRRFPVEPDAVDPLDRLSEEAARRFGSYDELTRSERFRFAKMGPNAL